MMHRRLIGSALALTCFTAVPFAQQQQPAPAPEATPAHKVYVLTGCLQARADAANVFTLSDASAIGEAPPAPVAPAEPSPVGTSGKTPSFELLAVSGLNAQGKDAVALKAHAGQRVEVTVRPADVVAEAPAPGSVTTPQKPADPAPVRYTVTEIKTAMGVCS